MIGSNSYVQFGFTLAFTILLYPLIYKVLTLKVAKIWSKLLVTVAALLACLTLVLYIYGAVT